MTLAPDAQSMILDPTYNFIGKWLGIDMKSDWNKNYQKIYLITEYAKEKSKSNDLNKIVNVLKGMLNNAPQIAERRIDDLVCEVKLAMTSKNEPERDYNGNKKKILKKKKKAEKIVSKKTVEETTPEKVTQTNEDSKLSPLQQARNMFKTMQL